MIGFPYTFCFVSSFQGRDYLHCKYAPVRIVDYFVKYGSGEGVIGVDKGGVDTMLTGIVNFTERAESHQGLCHGGSMCRYAFTNVIKEQNVCFSFTTKCVMSPSIHIIAFWTISLDGVQCL